MTMKQAIVVLLAAGLISACGGGGDSPALTPDEVERAQSDPRVVRVGGGSPSAPTRSSFRRPTPTSPSQSKARASTYVDP